MIPGLITIVKIFRYGLGVLPLNQGIFWGTLIINFIFWIGVAHAGTFISAILLLLRQNWREEIHRFAEAMTIIAVIIAALMPIFHLGKPIYILQTSSHYRTYISSVAEFFFTTGMGFLRHSLLSHHFPAFPLFRLTTRLCP
jgi:formate-dependent nitrite reductase membrane component NrfD